MININKIPKTHVSLKRGVYFLFQGQELVYIGKYKNIHARIGSHLNNKKFDYYSFIEIDKTSERNILEKAYIISFRPKYNKSIINLLPSDNAPELIEFKLPECLRDNNDFRNIHLVKNGK